MSLQLWKSPKDLDSGVICGVICIILTVVLSIFYIVYKRIFKETKTPTFFKIIDRKLLLFH